MNTYCVEEEDGPCLGYFVAQSSFEAFTKALAVAPRRCNLMIFTNFRVTVVR